MLILGGGHNEKKGKGTNLSDWVQGLDGKRVVVYVRGLSEIPREDGARLTIWGEMRVYEDFVTVQISEEFSACGVRIRDIISIEEEDQAWRDDFAEGEEERGLRDEEEVDYDEVLRDWVKVNKKKEGE
jgi:hypothetical protein